MHAKVTKGDAKTSLLHLYNKEKTCFFVRPSVRQHFYISRCFSKSNIDTKKIISELGLNNFKEGN